MFNRFGILEITIKAPTLDFWRIDPIGDLRGNFVGNFCTQFSGPLLDAFGARPVGTDRVRDGCMMRASKERTAESPRRLLRTSRRHTKVNPYLAHAILSKGPNSKERV